jgi:hypothetical protein
LANNLLLFYLFLINCFRTSVFTLLAPSGDDVWILGDTIERKEGLPIADSLPFLFSFFAS